MMENLMMGRFDWGSAAEWKIELVWARDVVFY